MALGKATQPWHHLDDILYYFGIFRVWESAAYNCHFYFRVQRDKRWISLLVTGFVESLPETCPGNGSSQIMDLGSGGAFVIFAFAAQWPAMFAVTLHSKAILATTLIAVGTGIFEESLFRGTFFSVFMANMQYRSRSYQLTRSAIYSSIIFGLIHLTNVIGGNLQAVLQQVVYAMAFGLFLCVIRVMTNTLLWVIIIHTVADWAPATATGSGPTEVSSWWLIVGVFGLLMLVSLVYLVKVDRLLERSANLGMPNEQGG